MALQPVAETVGARLENPPSPIARQLAAPPIRVLAIGVKNALDMPVQCSQHSDARAHHYAESGAAKSRRRS
jgi:hypothetical protein